MNISTKIKSTNNDNDHHDDDVTQLRNEIDEMRKEALQKLNNLDIRASSTSSSSSLSSATSSYSTSTSTSTSSNEKERIIMDQQVSGTTITATAATTTTTTTTAPIDDADNNNNNGSDIDNIENDTKSREFMEQIAVSNDREALSSSGVYSSSSPSRSRSRDVLSLLDNTTWKISLNIGREPGM